MIPCLDIHTHHSAPQPAAVVNVSISGFNPLPEQRYSIGFHPWETIMEPSGEEWEMFEKLARQPQVVAIGECGIDTLKGAPLFIQMTVMKRQIDISERLQKPLIIHDVKAHDIIIGLKRDLKPKQKWMIHGFRGKPGLAKMMTDAGLWLSFGQKFNPLSPASISEEFILAETDESILPINEIIAGLSAVMKKDMMPVIERNTARFLGNLID